MHIPSQLDIARKMHGSDTVVAAIGAANGDVEAALKELRRVVNRNIRKRGMERHQSDAAGRTDAVLYRGPVEIGPTLRQLIDAGRRVSRPIGKSERIRSVFHGRIVAPDGDESSLSDAAGYGPGKVVIVVDPKSVGGPASAEVIFAPSRSGNGWSRKEEYRIHIWHRSATNPRTPINLDLATTQHGTIMETPAEEGMMEYAEYVGGSLMPPLNNNAAPTWHTPGEEESDMERDRR